MSEPIDEPAFPCTEAGAGGGVFKEHFGVTIRDYFAAKAMAALPHMGNGADLKYDELSQDCYLWADMMLAERKKGQP